MVIKRYPDGRTLIGTTTSSKSYQSNEYGIEMLPIGTVQVTRQDNSTSGTAYAIVTVPTGTTFATESTGLNSGFNMDDDFTIRADMYMKGNMIKFAIYTQVYDYANASISESLIGYVFPVGSTSDLTGFKRITSISVMTDYEDGGGTLFNIADSKGTTSGYCYVNSSLQLQMQSNVAISSTSNILLEIQTVTNELLDTVSDVQDTVSDLSSESAAKFVSR